MRVMVIVLPDRAQQSYELDRAIASLKASAKSLGVEVHFQTMRFTDAEAKASEPLRLFEQAWVQLRILLGWDAPPRKVFRNHIREGR